VSVRLVDRPGRWRLSVVDRGTGFDPRGVVVSGTGVGLVNMRDRLDAVGGTLSVESQPGRGTTVTAEVPRILDRGAGSTPPLAAPPAA
jgi:signal transduction histidine kinase